MLSIFVECSGSFNLHKATSFYSPFLFYFLKLMSKDIPLNLMFVHASLIHREKKKTLGTIKLIMYRWCDTRHGLKNYHNFERKWDCSPKLKFFFSSIYFLAIPTLIKRLKVPNEDRSLNYDREFCLLKHRRAIFHISLI